MIQLPSLNICELAVHITVHVHPMEACIQQLHPFLTFNLSTIWKQVVSFRPRPSHPRGNNLWPCGPQQLVWTFWRRENKSVAPTRNQTLDCSTVIIQSLHITPDWSQSLTLSLTLLVLLSYSLSL